MISCSFTCIARWCYQSFYQRTINNDISNNLGKYHDSLDTVSVLHFFCCGSVCGAHSIDKMQRVTPSSTLYRGIFHHSKQQKFNDVFHWVPDAERSPERTVTSEGDALWISQDCVYWRTVPGSDRCGSGQAPNVNSAEDTEDVSSRTGWTLGSKLHDG